jgi:CarD family transcriptional regulator
MDFKLGDKVVYPNQGVGIIEQISFNGNAGRPEKHYVLRIAANGLRVMVPQSNVTSVGLRPVIRSGEASKVLAYLEAGKFNSHHDWKYRFKENSERMRTGSLLEVAVVLKSLLSLARSKPLSFREKKMLERAKHLLVTELATARNASHESIETTLNKALAKARLHLPEISEEADA